MIEKKTPFLISLALIVATGSLGATTGCRPPEPPELHPQWPNSPAPTRIRHIKNVRKSTDLVRPGFFDNIGQLIAGSVPLALISPNCLAVVENKYLYVTDQEHQAVIVLDLKKSKSRIITKAGKVFFVSPVGIAVCGEMLAVADSALGEVFLLDAKDKLIRTLQKPPAGAPSPSAKASGFSRPTGLAWDPKEKLLYVVDTLANEICVFNPVSGRLVRRFGSHGTNHGQFNYPTHISLDQRGKIYVTDSLNFRVQMFDMKGKYLFHIGTLGDASGHLAVPKGVGIDRFGHIYIVDSYLSTIQIFDQKGRYLLGIGGPGRQSGQFQVPTGLAVDSENKIYICDSLNNRVQILQYVGAESDEQDTKTP
jgi:DNA-binding beta-propeller fold protein YncE